MQFVSLIETVIVFIQEVIKMMKINKLSAFILAGALTCTAPAMVYADQTTDAAVDQAVELLEQSGVDDLLSDPDKVVVPRIPFTSSFVIPRLSSLSYTLFT